MFWRARINAVLRKSTLDPEKEKQKCPDHNMKWSQVVRRRLRIHYLYWFDSWDCPITHYKLGNSFQVFYSSNLIYCSIEKNPCTQKNSSNLTCNMKHSIWCRFFAIKFIGVISLPNMFPKSDYGNFKTT